MTVVVRPCSSSGSVLRRADRLAGARDLVPGQREAEQADADHGGRDDRQHDMAEGLPRRRAEVARGFLVAPVEAVEDREHDQQAERQRPGEMRAEARGEQAHRGVVALRSSRSVPTPSALISIVDAGGTAGRCRARR